MLGCLIAEPGGQLRQADLAARLGWDKSRLSHQLTRMAHRELIERRKSGRLHGVAVTRAGLQKFELADSVHVAAVRRLQEHLSKAEREALQRTAVLAPPDTSPRPADPSIAPTRAPQLRARTS